MWSPPHTRGKNHTCPFQGFCLLLAYEYTSRKRLDILDFSLLMITCSGLSSFSPMNSDSAACHTLHFPRADQSDDCFPAWRTMDSSDALKRPLNGWVVSKLKASVLLLRWWVCGFLTRLKESSSGTPVCISRLPFFKSENQLCVSLPLTSCTCWCVKMTSVSSLIFSKESRIYVHRALFVSVRVHCMVQDIASLAVQ